MLTIVLFACVTEPDETAAEDSDTTETRTDDTDTPTDPDDGLDLKTCQIDVCGGKDIVGEWQIAQMCQAFNLPTSSDCDEASHYTETTDFGGTWTFNGDGTYSSDYSYTLSIVSSFPPACNDEITSCDDWGKTGGDCEGTPEAGCTCTLSVPAEDTTSGTWSQNGSILALDGTNNGFCLKDGRLEFATAGIIATGFSLTPVQ